MALQQTACSASRIGSGRYSLWGPVGLSLMIAIGPEHFSDFLAGACAMDDNFLNAGDADNLPLTLALVGLWQHNFCGYETRASRSTTSGWGCCPPTSSNWIWNPTASAPGAMVRTSPP